MARNLSPELLTKVFEHPGVDDALVDEMLAQTFDDFHLLFRGKASNGGFDDTANGGLVYGDETGKMLAVRPGPQIERYACLW